MSLPLYFALTIGRGDVFKLSLFEKDFNDVDLDNIKEKSLNMYSFFVLFTYEYVFLTH